MEFLAGPNEFVQSILDSFSCHIVLLERDGKIAAINEQWRRLCEANRTKAQSLAVGVNYLDACREAITKGIDNAEANLEGIETVLAGRQESFSSEYPCHSENRLQWFSMTVTRLKNAQGGVVIRHENITPRKLAQQHLQANEELFYGIYYNAPFGIFHSTIEGKLINVNPMYVRIFGYDSAAEIIETVNRTNAAQALYAEPDRRTDYVKEVLKDDAWHSVENRYRRKNGEICWGRMSFRVFYNSVTERRELEGFVENITERKAALEALERYQLLAHNSKDIILFIRRRDGRIIEANEAACAAYGMSYNELLSLTIHDIRAEPTRGIIAEQMEAADKNGLMFETRHLRKNGSEFHIEVNSKGMNIGGERILLSVARDITERKLARAALEASEARYRELYEQSPLGYQSLDVNGHIIIVNRAWLNMLGYSKTEVIGKWFGNFLAPEYVESFRERFEAFKKAGKVHSEFEMLHKDGSRRFVAFEGTIALCEDGTLKQTHCVMQDITASRKAQREAAEYQNALAHASRLSTVGEMASSLAHELNGPFCAILTHAEGCLNMLKSAAQFDHGKMASKVETIVKQAERAGMIINRVKGFIRKEQPELKDVEINSVIRDVAVFVDTEAKRIKAKIGLDLHKNATFVRGDKVQLEQVILNLVKNGLEAMEETAWTERSLVISTAIIDGKIEIAVCDSGKGIGEEDIAKVFESFFTTKPYGLGIGLSICRSIIESHGGKIWAKKNTDQGMTFRFTLPAAV